MVRFADRAEAGTRLGEALLTTNLRSDALVLGLPRGGVPVAAGVAAALSCDLDVLVVRKLGVPGHEELAMGAIATGGAVVRNEAVCDHFGIPPEAFDRVLKTARRELDRRNQIYRPGRPDLVLAGRHIVVVDDGAATGASMAVALRSIGAADPASMKVGLPVASTEAARMLRRLSDHSEILITPEPFGAVGSWYRDFTQTTDAEVVAAMERWSA